MKSYTITYNFGQISSCISGAMRNEYKESVYPEDLKFYLDGKEVDVKLLSVKVEG